MEEHTNNTSEHPSIPFLKHWFKNCEGGTINLRFFGGDGYPKNEFIDLNNIEGVPEILARHNTQDNYFGAALRNGNDGTKEGISLIPGVWFEHDKINSELVEKIWKAPCPPSMIVQSSIESKWQVYYLWEEPLGKDGIKQTEDLILKLINYFGADPGAKDASRILRIPGTKNLKPEYNPPPIVIVLDSNDNEYNPSDFDWLPEPEDNGHKQTNQSEDKYEGARDGVREGEGRNPLLASKAGWLIRKKLPREDIMAILLDINKTFIPPFAQAQVGGILDSVYKTDAKKHPDKAEEGNKYKDIEKAFKSIDDFQALEIPPRKVIINPWLIEQSITLIAGWRGSGKTFFGLTLAICAVGGFDYPLGKWESINPVSALYIDAEMVGNDIQDRYHKLMTDFNNKEKLIIYSDHYANLLGLPPARMGDPKWRDAIKDFVIKNNIKLVFFDNISALCPDIDENLKHVWGPVNSWLLELRFAGVASVLMHHTGKKGDQRGISGREDSIDNSILLARPDDYKSSDGCRFNLRFTKARGVNDTNRKLISDAEWVLKDVTDTQSEWAIGLVAKRTFAECVLMLVKPGLTQKDIADELGITQQQVSKYKTQALVKGYLVEKEGRLSLTKTGTDLVKILPNYNNNWQDNDDPE